jgi:hypothetical protein
LFLKKLFQLPSKWAIQKKALPDAGFSRSPKVCPHGYPQIMWMAGKNPEKPFVYLHMGLSALCSVGQLRQLGCRKQNLSVE